MEKHTRKGTWKMKWKLGACHLLPQNTYVPVLGGEWGTNIRTVLGAHTRVITINPTP